MKWRLFCRWLLHKYFVERIVRGEYLIKVCPHGSNWQISIDLVMAWCREADAIWGNRSRSTLAQVMAWCLMAPRHYLNQCWLIIKGVLWHSPKSKVLTNFIHIMFLDIILLKLLPHLPGASELICLCWLSPCNRWVSTRMAIETQKPWILGSTDSWHTHFCSFTRLLIDIVLALVPYEWVLF